MMELWDDIEIENVKDLVDYVSENNLEGLIKKIKELHAKNPDLWAMEKFLAEKVEELQAENERLKGNNEILTNNNSQPGKPTKETNQVLLAMLKENGLKQTDLANKIGRDKSYINRVIHGKEEAPAEMKIKIAKILGVDSRVIFPC